MADELNEEFETATGNPESASLSTPEERKSPAFFYPTAHEFTGLVQTRIGAGAEFDIGPLGRKRAGEVFRVGSKAFAERLVYGGLHAHVDPNTPLGVPEALQPKAKE
jgi:hypothetical protein